jgi:cysteine desulfurase/selenocysteine lyase
VNELGIDAIRAHEQALTAELLERFADFPGLTIHGPADAADRGALVSFEIEGAHPHDIGEILGREGVCVRTGQHCAQPLMRRMKLGSTARASFAVHNTPADIDRLMDSLESVRRVMQLS